MKHIKLAAALLEQWLPKCLSTIISGVKIAVGRLIGWLG